MIAVGIDVGLQAIKIAVVEGSAKKPKLREFIDHRIGGGETTRTIGPDGVATILQRLLEERKLVGTPIVTCVPTAACLARELTVPFSRDEQIAKTIKFQAESVFPSTAIDDMLVEYYRLESAGSVVPVDPKHPTKAEERTRLLVVAMKKEIMRQHLGTLSLGEIDPMAVDLDLAAIYNAWTITKDATERKRTLIVDLGGGTLKVVIVEGGRLRAVRSLRTPAAGVKVGEKKKQRVTLEDLKAGLADDERDDAFFMEDEGRLPVVILDEEQSEVFDLAGESEESRTTLLEKIFLEIDRTLASARTDGPLEQVLLTGGGASAEGIEKAFTDHFQAPCERLSFAGAIERSGGKGRVAETLDLVGATALGLALKGIGHDKGGLDFRKEEFTFAGKFEKAKIGLACTLVLLFVFFFVLAYYFQFILAERYNRKQTRIRQYEATVFAYLFGEEEAKHPPKEGYVYTLKQRKQAAQGLSASSGPTIVSALDMMRDLAAGFEKSGKKLELKEVALKQKTSTLVKGEVDDQGTALDLKQAFSSEPRLLVMEDPKMGQKNPQTGKIPVDFQVTPVEEKKPATPPPAPTAAPEGG